MRVTGERPDHVIHHQIDLCLKAASLRMDIKEKWLYLFVVCSSNGAWMSLLKRVRWSAIKSSDRQYNVKQHTRLVNTQVKSRVDVGRRGNLVLGGGKPVGCELLLVCGLQAANRQRQDDVVGLGSSCCGGVVISSIFLWWLGIPLWLWLPDGREQLLCFSSQTVVVVDGKGGGGKYIKNKTNTHHKK